VGREKQGNTASPTSRALPRRKTKGG